MTKIRALQSIEKYLQMFQNIHLYLLVLRMCAFFPVTLNFDIIVKSIN